MKNSTSRTWVWTRSPVDRRFFAGQHLESGGVYRLVMDDFGNLVLV